VRFAQSSTRALNASKLKSRSNHSTFEVFAVCSSLPVSPVVMCVPVLLVPSVTIYRDKCVTFMTALLIDIYAIRDQRATTQASLACSSLEQSLAHAHVLTRFNAVRQ